MDFITKFQKKVKVQIMLIKLIQKDVQTIINIKVKLNIILKQVFYKFMKDVLMTANYIQI